MKKICAGLLIGIIFTGLFLTAPIIKVSDGYMSFNSILQLKIDCYDLWEDIDGKQIYMLD
jgi:hypothetical protein